MAGYVNLRSEAAVALGLIGDSRATEAVIAALEDPDPRVRRDSAFALGRLKGPQALPRLARAMTDPDPEVSASAIRALGDLGDPRGVELLMGLLAREDKGSHPVVDSDIQRSLSTLTNQNFLSDYDWRKWWEKNRAGFLGGK